MTGACKSQTAAHETATVSQVPKPEVEMVDKEVLLPVLCSFCHMCFNVISRLS